MKNTNICDKCGKKLTDEELEREADLCDVCQFREDNNVPDNQLSLW